MFWTGRRPASQHIHEIAQGVDYGKGNQKDLGQNTQITRSTSGETGAVVKLESAASRLGCQAWEVSDRNPHSTGSASNFPGGAQGGWDC